MSVANIREIKKQEKRTVEQWLNTTDYEFKGYMPSDEALMFVNFIKEVNDGSEENETPLVHLVMMDGVFNGKRRCAILCHRGIGKTSLFAEYLILFIAAFGYFPGFGKMNLMLYVTDSIENGVKNLRRNVEFRYANSDFLQKLIPNRKITLGGKDKEGFKINGISVDDYDNDVGGIKFTDIRLEFQNKNGHTLVVKGYGAKTGVRGSKELGQRPTIAILDDLVSDEDARSDTVISSIENTVYKAVSKAMHPKKQKLVWLGTPFNAKDPLYKAVESGAWHVSVFPIAEKFPVPESEFMGSWEDRFDYEYVNAEYKESIAVGLPEAFNQELMLRIMSDEDRLVQDDDIVWFKRQDVLKNKENYNFYITTDFATSEKESADFSVISVWAYNNNGDWLYVDGTVKRQLMNSNVDDVFRFVTMYKPLGVGIEISGQQGGFIEWIKGEMITRNIFFNLSRDKETSGKGTKDGLRPTTNKMVRFMAMVPLFKMKKIWFPEEMKESIQIKEAMDELRNASHGAFRSRHDDFIDTISMLGQIEAFKPSVTDQLAYNDTSNIWEATFDDEDQYVSSYVF